MKKYIKPEIVQQVILRHHILAGSLQSVDDTYSFEEELSDGPVDSYLSREGFSFFESDD